MRRLLVLIALALLLVIPASAWTTLETYSGLTYDTYSIPNTFCIGNASNWDGITRFEYTGYGIRSGGSNQIAWANEPFYWAGSPSCTNGGTLDITGSVDVPSQVASLDIRISNSTPPSVDCNNGCIRITDASKYTELGYWRFGLSNQDGHVGENSILHPQRFVGNNFEYFANSTATTYTGTFHVDPVADFNCTPVVGQAPLMAVCVDNSTGPASTWNWSGSGGSMLWGTPHASTTNLYLPNAGNYTVRLDITNILGSANLTKPDYIWVQNTSAFVTTMVTAIDALSSQPIQHATIDLYDVENGTWTNTTDATTGSATISTLAGHHVNAYASALGFDDNDKLGIPAGSYESILLFFPGLRNVTAGNVTLNVYTYDANNHAVPIKGVGITVAGPSSAMDGYTNAAGLAQFTVKNQTTYLVQAGGFTPGTGYQPATQTVSSGLGSGPSASVTVTFYLTKQTVTPPVTSTTGPGGTVPTTVDPYSGMSSTEKQSYLVDLILSYGPTLVLLFIVATIMGTVKMIGK